MPARNIDLRYHFIRFTVENSSIRFLHCPSTDMITDTLTKTLPSIRAKHSAFERTARDKQTRIYPHYMITFADSCRSHLSPDLYQY